MHMKPVRYKKDEFRAIYNEKGKDWTLETLAARTDMTKETARQALHRIEETEILRIVPRFDVEEMVRLIEEEKITNPTKLIEVMKCCSATMYKHLRNNGYAHLIGVDGRGRRTIKTQ